MDAQTQTQQGQAPSAEPESLRRLSDAALEGLASRKGPVSGESLAQALTDRLWLDELMNQVDGSGLRLTWRGRVLAGADQGGAGEGAAGRVSRSPVV